MPGGCGIIGQPKGGSGAKTCMMSTDQSTLGNALLRSAAILLAVVGVALVLAPGLVLYAAAWAWPGARSTVAVAGVASETERFAEVRAGTGSMRPVRMDTIDTADIAIDRVREGRSDAGIAPSIFLASSSGFEGVANLGWMYLHVIVPSGSNIHALRDLAGRKLGFGGGDPSVRVLLDRVFKYYGLVSPPQTIEQHNGDLEKAFLEGEIDAAAALTGLFDETVTALLATGWYELVPVPEADALAAWLPGTARVVFPPGVYGPERNRPDAASPRMPTLAVARLLFTRADASDTTVHALIERLESLLPAEYALVSVVDRREVSPLPMHAAAARVFAGVDSHSANTPHGSARWSGVLTLALAAMIAAWLRIQARQTARRRAFAGLLTGIAAQMQQAQSTLDALLLRWDRALSEMDNAPEAAAATDAGAAPPRNSVSIFAPPAVTDEPAKTPVAEVLEDSEIVGAARPRGETKAPRLATPAAMPEEAPDSDQMDLLF